MISPEFLHPFFDWAEHTWLGQLIPNSNWLFPAIEAVHLLGLAVIGGAILVVDMRLLGIFFRDRPLSEIAAEAKPYFVGALIVMLSTGIPLGMSEATKCFYSPAFWVKMYALMFSIAFAFLIKARVTRADEGRYGKGARFIVGALSLIGWFTVGAGGRWIGFS
jgi:hypothetical protein